MIKVQNIRICLWFLVLGLGLVCLIGCAQQNSSSSVSTGYSTLLGISLGDTSTEVISILGTSYTASSTNEISYFNYTDYSIGFSSGEVSVIITTSTAYSIDGYKVGNYESIYCSHFGDPDVTRTNGIYRYLYWPSDNHIAISVSTLGVYFIYAIGIYDSSKVGALN